jgi:type IV pilus assembly protein PilV
MMKNPNRRRHHQSGVALLEALVGFLIFSIGVLGLVGLQASMTRAQTSAKYRAEAALLANEIVGVMWGDADAQHANYAGGACAGYARCKEWQDKVALLLPAGQASLEYNPTRGLVAVTVSWSQPEEGEHQMVVNAVVPVPQ